jgi:hypothetical protein
MERHEINRRDLLSIGAACAVGVSWSAKCLWAANNYPDPSKASTPLRICAKRKLPEERRRKAFDASIKENPQNDWLKLADRIKDAPPGTEKAAVTYRKLWASNRTLNCRFLGGDSQVKKNVEKYAHEWSEVANVKFKFVDSGTAEIRIGFDPALGSSSYVGTDNLDIPTAIQTMNFGWLAPESNADDYSSVVLHEFGHALGMIHEHQSPTAHIPWNEPRVIEDCWNRMGWPAEQVRTQIFEPAKASETNFDAFDPTSIMMYSFPKDWTLDGSSAPWNTQLSDHDKDFMSKQYPKT